MSVELKESKYLWQLNETHTVVKVGAFTVKVVESHGSGLVTTLLLAGKGAGLASAHARAVKAARNAKENAR